MNRHAYASVPYLNQLDRIHASFFASVVGTLVSASAAVLAAVILWPAWRRGKRSRHRSTTDLDAMGLLSAFAAGALLSDVCLHILPSIYFQDHHETHHHHHHDTSGWLLLAGLLAFFLLEKWIMVLESRSTVMTERTKRSQKHSVSVSAWINLSADALHNFVDGIAVGAAFLAGPGVGASTTLAVWLHEMPQELGDYGVLLRAGMAPGRAFMLNVVCALSALGGNAVVYGVGMWVSRGHRQSSDATTTDMLKHVQSILLPFAAGGLLYMATASLLPQLHQVHSRRGGGKTPSAWSVTRISFMQVACMMAGALSVALASLCE